MLAELAVKEFLDKVAGSDPVPEGGSITALNGAVASALTVMVAGLTVEKEGCEGHEELMKHTSRLGIGQQGLFVECIGRDSETYDRVFGCFKLPRTTDEEKAARSVAIQKATRLTTLIPTQAVRNACELMEIMTDAARPDNRDTATDTCVVMMVARSAILGALLNVRINLASFKDMVFVDELKREACRLEQLAYTREKELLKAVDQELNQ